MPRPISPRAVPAPLSPCGRGGGPSAVRPWEDEGAAAPMIQLRRSQHLRGPPPSPGAHAPTSPARGEVPFRACLAPPSPRTRSGAHSPLPPPAATASGPRVKPGDAGWDRLETLTYSLTLPPPSLRLDRRGYGSPRVRWALRSSRTVSGLGAITGLSGPTQKGGR